jgi:hypothetical protein
VTVEIGREVIGSKTPIALKKLFLRRTASPTPARLERNERSLAHFETVRSNNFNRFRNANKRQLTRCESFLFKTDNRAKVTSLTNRASQQKCVMP